MRHTSTSILRASLSFSAIPLRIIALVLRTIAWILDPNGGAPWNWGPIPRPPVRPPRR